MLTAVQCLSRDYCSNSRVLRDWFNHACCEEIKHECPVDIKEIIAGDHNAVQHSFMKLSMGQIVSRIWTEIQKGRRKEMLLVALRKAGNLREKTTMVCNS